MQLAGHGGSERIKVVVAGLPQLLADMVRDIVNAQNDMQVAAEVASPVALNQALDERVDVLVTSTTDGQLAAPFRELLFGPRPVPIVVISLDGRRVDVFGRAATRGGGLTDLISLIRDAACFARVSEGRSDA